MDPPVPENMKDFCQKADAQGFEYLSLEEAEGKITELITKFLKERKKIKLTTEASDKLSKLLLDLYFDPQRLNTSHPLNAKRLKHGQTSPLKKELKSLKEALILSDLAEREIIASIWDMEDGTHPLQRLSEHENFKTNLLQAIDNALARIEAEGFISDIPEMLQPQNLYFLGAVEAYLHTIMEENPKAGFSDAESADLYIFMAKVVTLMDPNRDSYKGLRNRIKQSIEYLQDIEVLETLQRLPPSSGGLGCITE